MNTNITATEARKIAQDIAFDKQNKEYDKVKTDIIEKVKVGEFELRIFIQRISPECEKWLKDEGFTMTTCKGGMNEEDTIIHW